MKKLFVIFFLLLMAMQCFGSNPETKHRPFEKATQEVQELYYEVNCKSKRLELGDVQCPAFSSEPHGLFSEFIGDLKSKALLEYSAKFGHLKKPSINKAQLPEYEKLAEGGDINAIFEVYRYYKNPSLPDYSFFEIEANKWLLKAIELGSEAAMLEMGYNRPYARETIVADGELQAAIIANCESIGGNPAKVNHLLFRLRIGERNNNPYYWTIITDPAITRMNIRPQKLAIIANSGEKIVELTSCDDKGKNERKDYFSFSGEHLGSNTAKADIGYFSDDPTSLPVKQQKADIQGNATVVAETVINIYPFYEAFEIEEEKRQVLVKSMCNPSFTVVEGLPSAADLGLAPKRMVKDSDSAATVTSYFYKDQTKLQEKITEFEFQHGYHPLDMPNILHYGNYWTYWIPKAKNGDLYAWWLMGNLLDNPLSFVHDPEYAEIKNPFLKKSSPSDPIYYPKGYTPVYTILEYIQDPVLKYLLSGKANIKASTYDDYNPIKVEHPYIRKHAAIFEDTLITIYIFCESYNDEGVGFVGRENAYAFRIKLESGTNHDAYYLNDIYYGYSLFYMVPILKMCIVDGAKYILLGEYSSDASPKYNPYLFFRDTGFWQLIDYQKETEWHDILDDESVQLGHYLYKLIDWEILELERRLLNDQL